MHFWLLALAATSAQPLELDCHLGGGDEELRWRIILDERAGTLRQEQRGGVYQSIDAAKFTSAAVTVATPRGILTLDRATMRLTRQVPAAGRYYSGSCAAAPGAPVSLAGAGTGTGASAR